MLKRLILAWLLLMWPLFAWLPSTPIAMPVPQLMQKAIVNTPAPVAGGTNCSACTYVTGTNSGGTNEVSDPTSVSVTAGYLIIAFGAHSNRSGSGTTTVASSNPDTWYACSSTSTNTFTDVEVSSADSVSCNYTFASATNANDTVTITATDCSANCSFVGGSYVIFSGVHSWDSWGYTGSGTSTTGSNNTHCAATGTDTTTQANDLIICGNDFLNGSTATAGTTPITFTLRQPATNVAVESAVWSSSGAINPSMTDSSSSDSYGAVTVTFK